MPRPIRMTAPGRRAQLLDLAALLVSDRGLHGVSIEAISRSAGVTRATVYQHFTDLQALLEALIRREISRALAQLAPAVLPNLTKGDPPTLMLESLAAYLHAVLAEPRTWRLILMPPEGAPESLHASIAAGREAVLTQLTEAVRPALLLDDHSPDAPLTARLLSAISDEYARLLASDPERFPPERLLRHARWWLGHAFSPSPSPPGHEPPVERARDCGASERM